MAEENIAAGPPLRLEKREGVARITLSRPDVGNVIDVPMAQALQQAALEIDEDDAIRVAVLTGEGRLFCGGGDIRAFAEPGRTASAAIKTITGHLHSALARLARMEKPLLTVINGPAAGAGLGLAVVGDVAIAARSAHFSSAYTAIGLTPDAGTTWLLPRLVGDRRARELIFTNRRLTADEAVAWGLIDRAVPDAELEAAAEELIEKLGRSAIAALGRVKQLLLASATNGFETQMELEARTISASAGHAEGQEGISAFRAKRAPVFR